MGLAVAATAVVAGPLALWAQDRAGISLTYGIDSGISWHDNIDLDVANPESSALWDTGLSFGLQSANDVSFLALNASALLRQKLGGDTNVADGVINPSLRLSFGRDGARASVQGGLFIRESDLSTSDEFIDLETGELFDERNGTRRDVGGNVQLSWSLDTRVTWRAGVSFNNATFTDSPGNADRDSLSFTGGANLALSETMSLDIGLSRSQFQEDGEEERITDSLNTRFNIDRPDGSVNMGLTYTDTPDGSRTGISLGRSFDLPRGTLYAQIGATRLSSGNSALTGALNFSRELPRGQISASLSHDVNSSSNDDSEVEVTRASASISQNLSERDTVSFSLSLAEQTYTDESQSDVSRLQAGLNYARELGHDWQATARVGYVEREDGDGRAQDNNVYIGLRKTFVRNY